MGLILSLSETVFNRKGKKRPLNKALLRKILAAAANTYQDKKVWTVTFYVIKCA